MSAANLALKARSNAAKVLAKSSHRPKIVKLVPKRVPGTPLLSERARAELILKYQIKGRKMAFSILRRWRSRIDNQEVESIVDLSLCEAAKSFNPKKGVSFITFLYYHLKGNLVRSVTAAAKLNAIPFSELEQGGSSSDDIEPQKISDGRILNSREVAESLCNQTTELPDEALLKKELANITQSACQQLDSLEKEILERLFVKEEQLVDIANSLGYSRCHISRVKRKALHALGEVIKACIKETEVLASLGLGENGNLEDVIEISERKAVLRRKPRASEKRPRVQDARLAA